jgi:hypothetical protein
LTEGLQAAAFERIMIADTGAFKRRISSFVALERIRIAESVAFDRRGTAR